MSEEQKPDTVNAVKKALLPHFTFEGDGAVAKADAAAGFTAGVAIAAHNAELERLGYVIVKLVKLKAVLNDSGFETIAGLQAEIEQLRNQPKGLEDS